jgi:amidophosphoribosyltransferase
MCGIAAAIGTQLPASLIVAEVLRGLQNRGPDGAGIVSAEAGRHHEPAKFHVLRGAGRVSLVLHGDWQQRLVGSVAIGHVRYATTGSGKDLSSLQPLVRQVNGHMVALAHNGNLPNASQQRQDLERAGCSFASESDTEVLLQLMVQAKGDLHERVLQALEQAGPAWAVVGIVNDTVPWMFAGRDPYGFRPLCYAPYAGGFVIASETCALERLGIDLSEIVAIQPGEVVMFRHGEVYSHTLAHPQPTPMSCAFESVYFAMPNTQSADGDSHGSERLRMGSELAREDERYGRLPNVDIVIPVPDSGNPHAAGYAWAIGKPLVPAILRRHGSGRTFLGTDQSDRERQAHAKFSYVQDLIAGKHVIVVDDSLVRGTVMTGIARKLRQAGAVSVHVRIASPPVRHTCRWGISIRSENELIARQHEMDQLAEVLGVDSLQFLSPRGLRMALKDPEGCHHCWHCFTGLEPY